MAESKKAMAEQHSHRLVGGQSSAWQRQERLDDAARLAIAQAEEAAGAAGLHHATSDLLLFALIGDDHAAPSRALLACGADPAAIRAEVARPPRTGGGSGRSPLNAAAREAVVLGVNEARRSGRERAGPGHLLLGVLQEGTGAGVRAIKRQGVSLTALRDAVNGQIDEHDLFRSSQVDQLVAELLERVESIVVCPGCAIRLPAGFNYCYRCGAKIGD
ncbi:MAG TPA: Clp protease N-terminal domain-containing protein [Chloroflexota bacterium]|nr:Clp protease N-terminal domain-containing protein [Chloroflexota bacterium]